MSRSQRQRRRRLVVVSAVGVLIVLAIGGLVYLDRYDDTDDEAVRPPSQFQRPSLTLPAEATLAEQFGSDFVGTGGSTVIPPFGSGGIDGGTFGPGSHDVEFRVTSDAAVGMVGYWTRGSEVKSVTSGETSLSIRATADGVRPAAQLGVQVTGNGSFVTCTIYVDGARIVSTTARGRYHIAICTA